MKIKLATEYTEDTEDIEVFNFPLCSLWLKKGGKT